MTPDLLAQKPAHLVVIGAAAGMGRWLGDHVFSELPWESVRLIDSSPTIHKLAHTYRDTSVSLSQLRYEQHAQEILSGTLRDACIVVSVPLGNVPDIAAWLTPALGANCMLVDTCHDRARAAQAWAGLATVGLHPLFGPTTPSAAGQTFVLCAEPEPSQWLRHAIERVGGTVNAMTNERHDEIMSIVQRASHEALLSFADVVGRSGLDLESDLWANRTPVFELLTALAVRVLQPGQDATTASIQTTTTSHIDHGFIDANQRLREARVAGEPALLTHIAQLREPFSGGLFAKIAQAGSLATSAVQASRARISEHRRAGELLGVRTIGTDKLQVGYITATTPTSFMLNNVLVGTQGRGALLVDSLTTENAKKLGILGKPKTTEFRLGRSQILSPSELESTLDDWLATVTRGCKVFIPESISGASAARVVSGVPTVRNAELITEEVRIGQRECVIRYTTRIDRDVAALERSIQERIDATFVWPDGAVLPVSKGTRGSRIGYLGPSGTFSDVAARQLARLIDTPDAERVEHPDFAALVQAVATDAVHVAVLPITNSSSGLVDLAAGVLYNAPSAITVGGVVDVPVRFDAYVAPGTDFAEGSVVYSHPQGFRQCSQFVAAHNLTMVECNSTAEACRRVAEHKDGVALAATGMNADFGLLTARSSVGNLAGALTRFLVLGKADTFSQPTRADSLLRSVWLVDPEAAGKLPLTTQPRYDEVLRGPSGRTLLISTDPHRIPEGTSGVRFVATFPWSPRTPLVVVE